jgi:beta-mannosidase
MRTLSLDGTWDLIERSLAEDVRAFGVAAIAKPSLQARVPGDVNDDLIQAGRVPEPLTGINFHEFEWVKRRSWWYRRSFRVPADWPAGDALELRIDGLDVCADIWLNGTHLGVQRSAFYPFVCDVSKEIVRDDNNVLIVRVTTGAERVPDKNDWPLLQAVPTEGSRGYPERGNHKRVFLRKPAYVWGWDWTPNLPTCGITGHVELRSLATTEILDVSLVATLDGTSAYVRATVELDHRTLTDTARGTVALELSDEAGRSFRAEAADTLIRSGVNYIKLTLHIPDAKLWWPNGSGPQHRYTVRTQWMIGEKAVDHPSFKWGLRTVELDTSPGRFAFVINGAPIFMKGGNWIPCDSLYGRIAPEKVTRLVEEAAEANFNILRIWGGGRFELDAFYDACDRCGILVWHDFMSACAPLPAEEEWFTREFMAEAEYQIRRLRNRACMALWSGNNEVGGCYYWFKDFSEHRDPAWPLYFKRLPELVERLSPHIPYWPTSPYGGVNGVGSPTEGDDHHWVVMRPDKQFWSTPEYWDGKEIPIFNSEYGYGGPCSIESTRQYLGTNQPDLFSETVRQHTNTFYDIPRVNWSIEQHYRDTDQLPLQDFILLGGLCQGLNLGYSLESLRANEQSMGGIFWMYDDAWGENGWTIIDYYLRRKVSYYNVKRCLASRRLVLRRGGQAFGGAADEVLLIALNDTAEPVECSAQLGYVSYDGTVRELRLVNATIPARSKTVVGRVTVPDEARLQLGTIVAIPKSDGFEPATWRHCRFRQAGIPKAELKIEGTRTDGADLLVTVKSASFAHAVHFDLPGDVRLSDHYFDLLPDERREVRIYGAGGQASLQLVASALGSETAE